MEEIMDKFIEEGKREQEEMEAFIREFRTTNKLHFKERNNSLSELEFEVYGLSRTINKAQKIRCEAKGVTTRDLEASISLIPYTMYEKLGLGEPKSTRMSLELADRSIQYSRGIVENVLIKVDKFILPIDFVILDMQEDSKISIDLGRPFLATAMAMIDHEPGLLILSMLAYWVFLVLFLIDEIDNGEAVTISVSSGCILGLLRSMTSTIMVRKRLVLRVKKKIFVIEQPLPMAPTADSAVNVLAEWNALYDAYNEVACLMLGSITSELHRQFENYSPYKMLQELKSMFEKQSGVERRTETSSLYVPQDIIVGLILNGLTKDFVGFVRNYNMHNIGKTIGELHAILIEYEKGLPKKAKTPQVIMIKGGKILKSKKESLKSKGSGKANGKGNDKQVYIPKPKNPKPAAKEHPTKDDTCHHCKEMGH
nr:hypothetical protein [Tanacetum cinerariifolium]